MSKINTTHDITLQIISAKIRVCLFSVTAEEEYKAYAYNGTHSIMYMLPTSVFKIDQEVVLMVLFEIL